MFHTHGLARLTSGPPQLWEGPPRRRGLVRTCPTLLGQLRARPWIPRLGTPMLRVWLTAPVPPLPNACGEPAPAGGLVSSRPWFENPTRRPDANPPAPSTCRNTYSVSRLVRAAGESSPCACNTDAKLLVDANVFRGAAPSTRRSISSVAELIRAASESSPCA